MSHTKSIVINGRRYDEHTGLALDDTPGVASKETPVEQPSGRRQPAPRVHVAAPQRSHTLNRRALTNPHSKNKSAASSSTAIPVRTTHDIIHPKRPAARTAHQPSVSTSAHITKFAAHPAVKKPDHGHIAADITPATLHPHVQKAHAISQVKAEKPLADAPQKRLTTQEIKQSAIQQALHNTSVNHKPTKGHVLKKRSHPRIAGIASATLGLVMLGGYFTYLNMPSISTKVAAAQAGINASYPNYRPDGYSLNGLVGYQQDAVTMKFASNSGPQSYTLNQSKSNWDSSALLDNYIAPRTGNNYVPYTEQGLTIYTYGNNAAWVNGGILYTVEGDAPLSNEQLRHIATSLI